MLISWPNEATLVPPTAYAETAARTSGKHTEGTLSARRLVSSQRSGASRTGLDGYSQHKALPARRRHPVEG